MTNTLSPKLFFSFIFYFLPKRGKPSLLSEESTNNWLCDFSEDCCVRWKWHAWK